MRPDDIRRRAACAQASRESSLARSGFVLPPVIVATVLIALLAGSMQFAAWRAAQASRLAWNGARALHAADEVIARVITDWNATEFSRSPIGSHRRVLMTSLSGVEATVTVVRTQPLGGWIEADARSATDGAHRTARRRVARAVMLTTPALPAVGAVTALGDVRIEAGAMVSGLDDARAIDECGPTRDTNSVAGVASLAHVTNLSVNVNGAPAVQVISDTATRSQFDEAWNALVRRAHTTVPDALDGVLITTAPWASIVVTAPVVVAGNDQAQYEGLLAIDGDLVVRGTLSIRGALIVRGAVDTRDGALRVEGAMLVQDRLRVGAVLGTSTIVRYSQCALRRALATVALPSGQAFGLWQER